MAGLPDSVRDRPGACACETRDEVPCFVIDVRDDRRRSLVLRPGTRLRSRVEVGTARALRFSVAAIEHWAAAFDVRVRATDRGSREVRQWHRHVNAGEGWIDGAVDLSGLSDAEIEVDVTAASRGGAEALLALAAPRLITPVNPAAATGPTNVIVYLIDTLRADHVSLYGYARSTTPRLDMMARDGVVFDNAYSTAAWTRASTASLLTGLHSTFHGATVGRGLRSSVNTLAERFRAAGWSTWAFVANGNVFGKTLNFEQGFDRFVAIRGARRNNHARTAEVNALMFPYLESHADEPFFLYVHAVDPHSPYDPPEGYRDVFTDLEYAGAVTPAETVGKMLKKHRLAENDLAYIRALYDEDIRYQDAMLGELVDLVRELGLDARTMVVVTSDHGEEFFEHGAWEHGNRLYEEQVRVPLVFWTPMVPSLTGRRIRTPVQLIDVMPTLLHSFGLGKGASVHGRDLGPYLASSTRDQPPRLPIYCEEIRQQGKALFSLTVGPWKVIYRRSRGQEQYALFDLDVDGRELEDRAATDPEHLAVMQHQLNVYRENLGLPGFRSAPGPREHLPPETREQLEALGYVSGDGAKE